MKKYECKFMCDKETEEKIKELVKLTGASSKSEAIRAAINLHWLLLKLAKGEDV